MIYEWTCPACGNVVRATFMRVGAAITCPGCGQQQAVKDESLVRKPDAAVQGPKLTAQDLASLGDSAVNHDPSLPVDMEPVDEDSTIELASQQDPNQETVIEPIPTDSLGNDAPVLEESRRSDSIEEVVLERDDGGSHRMASKAWLIVALGALVGFVVLAILSWISAHSNSSPNLPATGGPSASPSIASPSSVAGSSVHKPAVVAPVKPVDPALARQTRLRLVPLATWSKIDEAFDRSMIDPDVLVELSPPISANPTQATSRLTVKLSNTLGQAAVDANVRILLIDSRQKTIARLDEPALLLHGAMPTESQQLLIPADLLAQSATIEIQPTIRRIVDASSQAIPVRVAVSSTSDKHHELALELASAPSSAWPSVAIRLRALNAQGELFRQWVVDWPYPLQAGQSLTLFASLPSDQLKADPASVQWQAYALGIVTPKP